jgi:hypothetical protein
VYSGVFSLPEASSWIVSIGCDNPYEIEKSRDEYVKGTRFAYVKEV